MNLTNFLLNKSLFLFGILRGLKTPSIFLIFLRLYQLFHSSVLPQVGEAVILVWNFVSCTIALRLPEAFVIAQYIVLVDLTSRCLNQTFHCYLTR